MTTMKETCTYRIVHPGTELKVAAHVEHRGPDRLLCLHGIQSNKNLFEGLLSQPFLSSFSLLALDFIGFGESSKPADFSYDIRDQANTVCRKRRLDQKFQTPDILCY